MKHLIFQLPDGSPIKVWQATSILARMKGLLGRKSLPEREAMLLDPCGSIHTFGMRFAIDVVFLDADWQVIGTRTNLRPGCLAWGGWRARRTIEAASGWLDLDSLTGKRLTPQQLQVPEQK